MTTEIKVLNASGTSRWDAFVRGESSCTPYHLTAWRAVLEQVFPLRTLYLYAMRQGSVTGILPIVQQRSVLFGNRFTSLPFCTYGGVRAVDPETERALLGEAVRYAAAAGARYLELRETREIPNLNGVGAGTWRVRARKVTLLLRLDAAPEVLFRKVHSTRRWEIRRAVRNELQFELGGEERLDDFYGVFARNMRDLGSPVYPKEFFRAMLQSFDREFALAIVSFGGLPVGGALLARWRGTLEIPLLSTLRSHRRLFPAAFLYWRVIEHAVATGCDLFDFGRCTPRSGTHVFKKQFNAYEAALPWLYWLAPGEQLPSLDRDESRFGMLIRLWQRLPLWLANRLGPPIAGRLY